jgi:hypothetical protein
VRGFFVSTSLCDERYADYEMGRYCTELKNRARFAKVLHRFTGWASSQIIMKLAGRKRRATDKENHSSPICHHGASPVGAGGAVVRTLAGAVVHFDDRLSQLMLIF